MFFFNYLNLYLAKRYFQISNLCMLGIPKFQLNISNIFLGIFPNYEACVIVSPASRSNLSSSKTLVGHGVVEKIVKLESSFQKKPFQLNNLPCQKKNLERTFRQKNFQLHDLSNYHFQLHVSPIIIWTFYNILPVQFFKMPSRTKQTL